jgi:RNA polymerase sigma factor (sigma-70 family)
MIDGRDRLRLRLYEAIGRFSWRLLRGHPQALRRERDDIVQEVWVKVRENPAEECIALTELETSETSDRLAPCVQRHIRNVIRRLQRYRRRTRSTDRPDERPQLDWRADPVAIEARALRIIDTLPPDERAVYDHTRTDRTQCEVARELNITDRTLRNRWNRMEAHIARALKFD